MSKQEISPEQFKQLLIACADLPFIEPDRWNGDYMTDVMLTVLDFHMQGGVVSDSLEHFAAHVQGPQGIETHAQLTVCLSKFPDTLDGNREASRFLWNNQHGVRANCLRRLLTFFTSVGVSDQLSLRQWARQAQFERDFKGQVKGLGIAVFHWLQIRCGVDTIKPDVWVIKFAQRVMGRRLSEKPLIQIFKKIAPLIGQSLDVIDATIWSYERMAMATHDVPALRIAFWHRLKAQLEARLTEDDAGHGVVWQIVLDDPALLRYDLAGLTMTGDRSLFGPTHHGISTVTLRQSLWKDGLLLELRVMQDTALSGPDFEKVKAGLGESGWDITNEPEFKATLDLEESLLVGPEVTMEELEGWVGALVGRVLERLRELGRSDRDV